MKAGWERESITAERPLQHPRGKMVGTRNQRVSADGWGAPVGGGRWCRREEHMSHYRRRQKDTGQGGWVEYRRCWGTKRRGVCGERLIWFIDFSWGWGNVSFNEAKLLRYSETSWWCSGSWNSLAVEQRAIISEKTKGAFCEWEPLFSRHCARCLVIRLVKQQLLIHFKVGFWPTE